MSLPPPEWKQPYLMRCPDCDHPMWFSRKKESKSKDLTEKKIKHKVSCYQCMMPLMKDCDDVEFLDLLKQL